MKRLILALLLLAATAHAYELDTIATEGDSINFSAVNPNSTGEGIILPQSTTLSGTPVVGSIGYGTTNDELCVFDGAVWDCQPADGQATGITCTDCVAYSEIQNISATSRLLGRITAGAGDTEELTGTQATTLLDVFTSALKGLVPASSGGTTNFLRADGAWAAPSGGSSITFQDDANTSFTNSTVKFPQHGLYLTNGSGGDANKTLVRTSKFATVYINNISINVMSSNCMTRQGVGANCNLHSIVGQGDPVTSQVRLRGFACSVDKINWDSTDSITLCPVESDATTAACVGTGTITVNNSTADPSTQRIDMNDLTTLSSNFTLLAKLSASDDTTAGTETFHATCEIEYVAED